DGVFNASGTVLVGFFPGTGAAVLNQTGGLWNLTGVNSLEQTVYTGTINLSGGTHLVGGTLSMALGSVNVSNGATLVVYGLTRIGSGQGVPASFNQTGGSSSFGSNVLVGGFGTSAPSTVNLSGGLFQVTDP